MKISIINTARTTFINDMVEINAKASERVVTFVEDVWEGVAEGDTFDLVVERAMGKDDDDIVTMLVAKGAISASSQYEFRSRLKKAIYMIIFEGSRARKLTVLKDEYDKLFPSTKKGSRKGSKAKGTASKPTLDVAKLQALVVKHGLSKAAAAKLCTESFAADLIKLVA